MVKKSRPRRGGIQRGVQKHKIKIRGGKSLFDLFEYLIPKHYIKDFYKLADNIFNIYINMSCKLCLLPYTFTADHEIQPADGKRSTIHHAAMAIFALSMLHKLGISIYRALFVALNASTFVCVATFLIYLVAVSMSASCLFRREETIAMVNGWPNILAVCKSVTDGRKVSRICNIKAAVVVTSLGILAFVIALAASVVSVIMSLPVFYYDTAATLGLIPFQGFLPSIVWKLLLWPLEFATYMAPMLIAPWGSMLLMLFAMVTQSCLDELRKIEVKSLDDRLHLRQQYLRLQAFNEISVNWIKFMVVPAIFSVSSTIIVCLYIVIRHPELNIFLYAVFAYVGISLFGLLFWICYEVIMVIRASEMIVGTLTSTEDEYYRELPMQQRMYWVKLGKGIRALSYRIGDFMFMSFDVPVGILDEIINQLVFLLSF